MPEIWKCAAFGPLVVQPKIVRLEAPRLRSVNTLVAAWPQGTPPKSEPFARLGASESAMETPLVPSSASPGDARRMNARGWPL